MSRQEGTVGRTSWPFSPSEALTVLRNSTISKLAVAIIGAALGWVAASGRLNPADWVQAAPMKSLPSVASEPRPAPCCDPAANRDAFLVNVKPGNQDTKSGKKPNILVIWGDDIGQSNVSAY